MVGAEVSDLEQLQSDPNFPAPPDLAALGVAAPLPCLGHGGCRFGRKLRCAQIRRTSITGAVLPLPCLHGGGQLMDFGGGAASCRSVAPPSIPKISNNSPCMCYDLLPDWFQIFPNLRWYGASDLASLRIKRFCIGMRLVLVVAFSLELLLPISTSSSEAHVGVFGDSDSIVSTTAQLGLLGGLSPFKGLLFIARQLLISNIFCVWRVFILRFPSGNRRRLVVRSLSCMPGGSWRGSSVATSCSPVGGGKGRRILFPLVTYAWRLDGCGWTRVHCSSVCVYACFV